MLPEYKYMRITLHIIVVVIFLKNSNGQYNHPHRCSNRLESALEHILRRNQMKSGSRTHLDLTPYSVYHSLYNGHNNDESNDSQQINLNEKLDTFYDKYYHNNDNNDGKNNGQQITKVEVADLRVRLPTNMRWVLVDRCQFSPSNRTLDTRLVFPDLTISGRVILHPSGGKCNMILRLRRAGIEFRTIPLSTSIEESRRSGTASVRTDSHFAEPGFLSVFAHGCQGPSGIKFRQNSKRRQFDQYTPSAPLDNHHNHRNHHHSQQPPINPYQKYYQRRHDRDTHRQNRDRDYYDDNNDDDNERDFINFDDNILDYHNRDDINKNSRTFGELFSSLTGTGKRYKRPPPLSSSSSSSSSNQWHNAETADAEEISAALSLELEQLFSMGVRGLLTTYMQKALQPAIKETLMEKMGYTLSYG